MLDLIEQAEHERITPAWAGKSASGAAACRAKRDHPRTGGEKAFCPPRPLFCRDHPRTGGENLFRLPLFQSPLGSPPRGRGKVGGQLQLTDPLRITPAWAGKRHPRGPCPRPRWDHPRVGGEKPAVAAHVRAQLGSPPHGRGKVVLRQVAGAPAGITPAWAGKRRGSFSSTSRL